MQHRHLNHTRCTLAAVDDIVCRGEAADWVDLHVAVLADEGVRSRLQSLCERHAVDVRAQRWHFWRGMLREGA